MNMEDFTRVQDFEKNALSSLAPKEKNYFIGSAGAHETTKRNIGALKKYIIIPTLLRDVSQRNISTNVLGVKVSMPVGISPTALQKWAHPDGEIGSAKAADIAGTIFIHSAYSGFTIEEIAAAAPKATKWQQLAIDKNRDIAMYIIKKAEQAGFKAIVVTVDNPLLPKSKTHNVILNEYSSFRIYEDYYLSTDHKVDLPNLFSRIMSTVDDSLTWKDISWLKSKTKLPIVVKGILKAEDALAAVNHGASAILVSNHGGRQLESPPTTIDALPEIVAAVGNRVEVYIDGGIREGADVFKILALGAKMAFIGRPIVWGLACGGQKGALSVLNTLRNEIDETFAMAGCRCVKEITKEFVRREEFYSHL